MHQFIKTFILVILCFMTHILITAQNVPKKKGKETMQRVEKKADDANLTTEERINKMIQKTEVKAKGKAKGKEVSASSSSRPAFEDRPQNNKLNTNQKNKEDKIAQKATSKGKQKNAATYDGRHGQERMQQAQRNIATKRNELAATIDQGQVRAANARIKVNAAKAKLEADKANNTISNDAYEKQKAKIERIENEIKVLEEKLKMGKKIQKA